MIEITPRLLDGIFLLIMIEFALIYVWLKRRNALWLVRPLFLFLGSGALLMIAVRTVLAEGDDLFLGFVLTCSLITHLRLLRWAYEKFLIPEDLRS